MGSKREDDTKMLGRDARDVTTVTGFKCTSRRYGSRAPRETRRVLSVHGAEL